MKGGEGTFLFCIKHFLHLNVGGRVWLGIVKCEFAYGKRKDGDKKAR